MKMARPQNLGDLRAAGYRTRPVKEEMRANLLDRLAAGQDLFPGVLGYDETVVPQLVNAILARQNFILLGLRGQAKSRIIRQLASLLDDQIPIIAGSEINDDPLRPVSRYGRSILEEQGDDTPVAWVGRDARYIEKLATPDVTVADIIGDLDPIRAARGGHVLADELTIHFGLLPRANRGIFAINELPDLAGRIQVALFNIMQEGDVQIKGYPVRLPLDVMLVFTGNPEDYTARGKIITPLKDRIGAEVMTHYPEEVEAGMTITRQEAWLDRDWRPVHVPEYVREVVERIAFLARRDKRIDQRSGVSQRLPITALETAVSNAERRAVSLGEERVVPRISDVHAALPAITGKLELEYEGELQGAPRIARELVSQAALETFESRRRGLVDDALDEIVDFFDRGGVLQLADLAGDRALAEGLATVPALRAVVEALDIEDDPVGARALAGELVLEALVAERRISRSDGGRFVRSGLPAQGG
jgi:magnesium chelatase subunit I